MFRSYNYLSGAVFSLVFVLFCYPLLALSGGEVALREKIDNAVCNISGECSADISDIAIDILVLCGAPKVEVAWSRENKNVFLVSCDCQCTSYDNAGWLIGKSIAGDKYEVWRLGLGKKYTVEELSRSKGSISDLFRSYSLCSDPDKRLVKTSVFVSLVKYPTNNETNPYCFSPEYIVEEGDRSEVNVYSASGEPKALELYKGDGSAAYLQILDVVEKLGVERMSQ